MYYLALQEVDPLPVSGLEVASVTLGSLPLKFFHKGVERLLHLTSRYVLCNFFLFDPVQVSFSEDKADEDLSFKEETSLHF